MELSYSGEANSFSISSEIPGIILKLGDNYGIHNSLLLATILSLINPIHPSQLYFLNIYFIIIFPPTPRSSKLSLFWGFPTKYLHAPPFSPIRTTCPTHLIILNLINPLTFGGQYRWWSPSLCRLPQSSVTLSVLGPNIFLSTLFLNTLSLNFKFWIGVPVPRFSPWKHCSQCGLLYDSPFF